VVGAFLLVRGRGSRRVAVTASVAAAAVVVGGVSVGLLTARSFDAARSSLWTSAIDNFTSAPLMGTGPGTYPVHRMDDTVDALSRLSHPDASNVVLTTASESGLVGLLGLGLAAAAYAIAIRRTWR